MADTYNKRRKLRTKAPHKRSDVRVIEETGDKTERNILAQSIIRISDGFNQLQLSGLNKRAIVILLQAETRLSQKDITTVLDALPKLASLYCRNR